MARRLIVDACILIAAERAGNALEGVIHDDDNVAIAAITLAELWDGAERRSGKHRAQLGWIDGIHETLFVEPYGTQTAKTHAKLLAHVRRNGRKRGEHDLVLAATALSTNRVIVTFDKKARFSDLPGVQCLLLPGC